MAGVKIMRTYGFGYLAASSIVTSTGFRAPNPGRIIEGDIHFNSTEDWDIYDGPRQYGVIDFKRVAVHEIGHVLGLNHSIFSSGVMYESVNDAFVLSLDDLCGIAVLHNTPEDCALLLGARCQCD